jgi:hypothetical protein
MGYIDNIDNGLLNKYYLKKNRNKFKICSFNYKLIVF